MASSEKLASWQIKTSKNNCDRRYFFKYLEKKIVVEIQQ